VWLSNAVLLCQNTSLSSAMQLTVVLLLLLLHTLRC
jgi:hypothetical protein